MIIFLLPYGCVAGYPEYELNGSHTYIEVWRLAGWLVF